METTTNSDSNDSTHQGVRPDRPPRSPNSPTEEQESDRELQDEESARQAVPPDPNNDNEAEEDDPDDNPQRARLTILAHEVDFFRSDHGEGYARFPRGDGTDSCPVQSEKFRTWLRHKYYQEYEDAPSRQALENAIATLDAKAEFEGGVYPVYRRVAGHEDGDEQHIYVDLCDERRNVVEITRDGWEIIQDPPVDFYRSETMQHFPEPRKGGDLRILRKYVNTDENGFALLLGFLIQAFNPRHPYPLLGIFGEQGSGKSTLMRMIHQLVDPSVMETRTFPRSMQDLVIAAEHSWLLAFDNSSELSREQSDMLCRMSTGSSFATRTNYSDRGEEVFKFSRPVIINGIEQVITEPDLADRSLFLNLQRLGKDERKTERDLWEGYREDRPLILGALFDAVSTALRRRNAVELAEKPRMADFAEWVAAAEPALPMEEGRFMEAYEANLTEAAEMLVKQNQVALEIFRLLGNLSSHTWEGTTEELRRKITSRVRARGDSARDIPQNPQGMTAALRRALPPLKKIGLVKSDARDHESHRAFQLTLLHRQ